MPADYLRQTRRFIKNWILRYVEDVSVDVRFKDLPPRTSYYADDGTETLVIALLEVTWWPKRPMTEMELMMDPQQRSKSWAGGKQDLDQAIRDLVRTKQPISGV